MNDKIYTPQSNAQANLKLRHKYLPYLDGKSTAFMQSETFIFLLAATAAAVVVVFVLIKLVICSAAAVAMLAVATVAFAAAYITVFKQFKSFSGRTSEEYSF